MENQLIEVKQLPIIEEQLRSIKVQFEKEVEDALSLDVSTETVKAVKESRANLTKIFNELEKRRIAVNKEILKPYDEFLVTYKECVTDVYKPAKEALDKKINEVEDGLKKAKENEIRDYFNELIVANDIDFVKFEQVGLKITLGVSKKKLKETVDEFINRINSDIELIATQEHKTEILVEYKKTLNASQSILLVTNRYKAIEAEKAKIAQAEELKKQEQEKIQEVEKAIEETAEPEPEFETPVDIPVEEPIEKRYKTTFVVYGTMEQLKKLKDFLNEGGYEYE